MPDSSRNNITLEKLLQLKRAEKPSPEFWDSFDRELHQRQLHRLVERRRWRDGLGHPFIRKVYVGIPVVATLLITLAAFLPMKIAQSPVGMTHAEAIVGVSNGSASDGDSADITRAGSLEPGQTTRFVMDALGEVPPQDQRFRRVMASPTVAAIRGSTVYVADPIPGGQSGQFVGGDITRHF